MSFMDLSSVVDDMCDTLVLTVTRSSASSYTAGRLDTPTASTFTITGKDLQRLPEGSRVSDARALFTTTELKTQGAAQSPDSVAIGGADYEVTTVEPWDTIGSFWKILALRKGN